MLVYINANGTVAISAYQLGEFERGVRVANQAELRARLEKWMKDPAVKQKSPEECESVAKHNKR